MSSSSGTSAGGNRGAFAAGFGGCAAGAGAGGCPAAHTAQKAAPRTSQYLGDINGHSPYAVGSVLAALSAQS